MPIYTYHCNKCGDKNIFQSIYDNTLTSCPDCDSIDFRKTFGAIGIAFKGSGFYSTDSRGGKDAKE